MNFRARHALVPRPEKRLSGDLSAAARGPTTSPHADFGACEPFFHLTPARPAPNAFLRDHISSTGPARAGAIAETLRCDES
jgi:hypothetical protein